ncbi:MAG: cytochrome c oxidase assembly protein [Candidatus Limnocylindrales bacterium]
MIPIVGVRRAAALGAAQVGLGLAGSIAPAAVLAHGPSGPAPVLPDVLLAWSVDPTVLVPLAILAVGFVAGVRRVDRAHPRSPVPRARTVCWLLGLVAILVALQSPIERYDTTLFSVHMVQHILLTLVGPPLLALGAPITLLLRLARPETRRRVILPILHSRAVRAVTFPVVSWLLLAFAMWGTHFSPLFDRSLEEPTVHQLEHLIYLVAGSVFWWPVIGLDPSPWRLREPARILYVFLQMPQNSFLGLAILSATAPLYPHYASLARDWGPSPLVDQQMAGAIMWIVGDLVFLIALLGIVAGWMRREEHDAYAADAREDRARAAIRERETRLADRLARERGDG